MKNSDLILDLQQRIDQNAVPKTKIWWENYLRGVIHFRGVGIPVIRKCLVSWRKETELGSLPLTEQLEIVLALFEEPMAEDKLAGILFIQEYLQDRLPWRNLFNAYEQLYRRKLIYDWNTCDWFCVRVIGPTLAREGKPCARVLLEWSRETYLWHARSGVVPFVNVADDPDFYADIRTVCSTLIKRDERFAKTSVGWLLRVVSKYDKDVVKDFIEYHAVNFSMESVRNACKYFTQNEKDSFIAKVRGTE